MSIINVSRDIAFDFEHIQAMVTAFDTVTRKLRLVRGKGDQLTELVALKIIDLATAGERSADRLANQVVGEFASQWAK
jgi:hypothetical protein